jgi:hypothetical protein
MDLRVLMYILWMPSVVRWSIGQEWDPSGPSEFLTGTVDDARFYSYPLSEAEIKTLYTDHDRPTQN